MLKNTSPLMLPPEVHLDGSGLRIGIIVARYNWDITGTSAKKDAEIMIMRKSRNRG